MTLHPFDPLSAEEIRLSSRVIRDAKPSQDFIFNSITHREPPKKLVLTYLAAKQDGSALPIVPRESFVVLIERGTGDVYEAVVDLQAQVLKSWLHVPGVQPTLTPEDCFEAERIALADEVVKKECAQLGIVDMSLVVADPWSIGYTGVPAHENKRLVQLFMFVRNSPTDNHYAHPLDFVTIVDLIAGHVTEIERLPAGEGFGVREIRPRVPKTEHNYDPDLLGSAFLRKDLKPLQVLSPEGPSFKVDGNAVEWQKFEFRLSFNYREGLVLHNLTYKDGDKVRPLLYRAALSEMAVPYGDPRPPFNRKTAFDVGDYGLGFCANSLTLGCDCLGTIQYFDGVLNDHKGEPSVIKNAVCIHEEDAGTLWKHTEYRTGKVALARSRRLVISFIVTVVNYEYALYWYLYTDATIAFEIKATGELSTNLLEQGATPSGYGTTVAPQINGQYHQHMFSMRLDPMIDGVKNTVSQVDVVPLEGDVGSNTNPYGQGFTLREIPLKTTHTEQGQANSLSGRIWKISNPSSLHPFTGQPVAWKLVPMNTPPLMAKPGSIIHRRAGFAKRSLWVTPYHDEQMFAAGFYVNQSYGGAGLDEWTKEKKNVEDEDVVIWHTFGVTHIPRVEDFPVMPAETCGFTLKPLSFFTQNPGLDIPPTSKIVNKSVLANATSCGCE